MVEPNSEMTFNPCGDNTQIDSLNPVLNFNLTQNVTSYENWTDAFIESVRKRATHGDMPPNLVQVV